MQRQLGALATCAAVFFCVFFRRRRRLSSLKDVPGPPNPSWIFGTFPEGRHGPHHSRAQADVLSVKYLKDINGIS